MWKIRTQNVMNERRRQPSKDDEMDEGESEIFIFSQNTELSTNSDVC